MTTILSIKTFRETSSGHPIIGFQSKETRALNVGFIEKKKNTMTFIPGRLNLGQTREEDTARATIQSLSLPHVKKILSKFQSKNISTVTLLREGVALQLPLALYHVGIREHYGDCYIGSYHIKRPHSIITAYLYENTEGLKDQGLWIIGDSIAAGRSLRKTLTSLFSKFRPKEILFIAPIANRYGLEVISALVAKKKVPATFVIWGALFGLNPVNKYDELWGPPDCEPIDVRDQKTFIDMYGPNLCVGGDFGNDYYCPALALKLYDEQLKLLKIKPNIPTAKKILSIYNKEEIVIRE